MTTLFQALKSFASNEELRQATATLLFLLLCIEEACESQRFLNPNCHIMPKSVHVL